MCRCSKGFRLSIPGVLGSGSSYIVSIRHGLIQPHAPVPQARCVFASLIRSAFAVRERLGDPRDLPYFCGCAFRACCRPYPGGPPCPSRCTHTTISGFLQLSKSRHSQCPSLPAISDGVIRFRGCIVRFMLRPARLPCPPDWQRRDEVTCASPRLLRYIVTPAFDAARCRTALGVRLDGRTGNLPPSGLSPDKSEQLVRLHDSKNRLRCAVVPSLSPLPAAAGKK
jgi:hypothetical protein